MNVSSTSVNPSVVHPSVRTVNGQRFAIVAGRFNHLVTVRLVEACTSELQARGASTEDIEIVFRVLPQAAVFL